MPQVNIHKRNDGWQVFVDGWRVGTRKTEAGARALASRHLEVTEEEAAAAAGGYPHEWQQEHSPDCPVVRYRADLLLSLATDPNNPYLLGALPEYDNGGDQEAENCTCGHWHPFRIGTRVRLRHAVDRYPHFLAPAGGLGTVTHEEEVLAVKLDEHLPGAGDWDNEVHWSLRDGDDPTRDLEVVPS